MVSIQTFLRWFWSIRRTKIVLCLLVPVIVMVLVSLLAGKKDDPLHALGGFSMLVLIVGGSMTAGEMQSFARILSRKLLMTVCALQILPPALLHVLSFGLVWLKAPESVVMAVLSLAVPLIPLMLVGFFGFFRALGSPKDPVRLTAQHVVQGRLPEALIYTDLAALSGEEGRQNLLHLSVELMRANQAEAATTLLERACQTFETDVNLWRGLGDMAWRAGKREVSLKASERALALAPKNADIYYDRGCKLSKDSSTYQRALEDYTKAIGLDGAKAYYWANRAALNGRMERYDHALADAKKAHSLDPSDQIAMAQGLNAAQKLGRMADVEFWMSKLEGGGSV